MSSAQPIRQPKQKATIAEYLAAERAAETRSEFLEGRIFAMAGEKLPHGIISANLVVSIGMQLKGTPCFVVTKDTKVRSGLGPFSGETTRGMFSYPDVLVICGTPEFFDEHHQVITNPAAILEVLSPSTEKFDRADKFHRYQTWNPTLQDYILVSQDKPQVEHFHRETDGKWTYQLHRGLDAVVVLPSIPCTLKLVDVYANVELPEDPEPQLS